MMAAIASKFEQKDPSASDFEKQKARSLSGIDNSRKGSIDQPIVDLVEFINKHDDFFTTSCCSGRIAVISEGYMKKKGCHWLYMSHEEAKDAEIVQVLRNDSTPVSAVLKYESFVLHMQCRSLEMAKQVLQVALQSGFRNSGLVIGKKKRIMLAVRSTHSMEVPLILNGKIMVSDEYVIEIVQICNEKLQENFQRIGRFFEGMRSQFPAI